MSGKNEYVDDVGILHGMWPILLRINSEFI